MLPLPSLTRLNTPGVVHLMQMAAMDRGLWLKCIVVVAALVSCGEPRARGRNDTGEVATGDVDTQRKPLPPWPDTGHTATRDIVAATPIQWTLDTVSSAVARAVSGPVIVSGSVRQPFMSQEGSILTADRATVQVFIYGDAGARGRDTDRLDTGRVAPPDMMVTWREPATLVVNNNLAAIVLTRDATLRHRIRDALSLRHLPSQR